MFPHFDHDEFDRKFDRTFRFAYVLATLYALALIAIVATGIYLLLKHFG